MHDLTWLYLAGLLLAPYMLLGMGWVVRTLMSGYVARHVAALTQRRSTSGPVRLLVFPLGFRRWQVVRSCKPVRSRKRKVQYKVTTVEVNRPSVKWRREGCMKKGD